MSTAVLSSTRLELNSLADRSLRAATRFWFAVMVVGQSIFAFAVASFYGLAALRGDSARAWSKSITHGYVPGDTLGNLAVATHLFSAAVIIVAGGLQLIPQIRNRFPIFHRWNGRFYVVTAFAISIAGLYMTWIRGSVGDLSQHVGNSLMAVLIMLCAVMALRYALARDFKTHRRWALRLYLVVSASIFIRAALFLTLALNHGPFGFDPGTFSGPFLTFIVFAQYLVPLAVLEFYLRAKEQGGTAARLAMAGVLFVLTLGMGAGISVVVTADWALKVKTAFDSRISIAKALSMTIASSSVEQAVRQYHELKATQHAVYNFDEGELDSLGYELLHGGKVKEAIRIFQLNVDAYPQASNPYDSLGEGYMNDGDKAQAVANYRKSLELNPKNRNAVKMLQKLNAP
jgi:tetratricopeptide (TPR) repeat protein